MLLELKKIYKGDGPLSQIPVTIFSGFLGSGKTTLINQLMNDPDKQSTFIIMNEFGETSIDHELIAQIDQQNIYQLNNGCFCCIAKNDLVSTFAKIMTMINQKIQTIDRIVIELSGLAEPSPIIQTILKTPFLSDYFSIDSIIGVVDAKNILYQLEHYPEASHQLSYTDKVILTKWENCPNLDEVVHVLHQLNPLAEVENIVLDEIVYKKIIGLNLFQTSHTMQHSKTNVLTSVADHHFNHHLSGVNSFSIVIFDSIEAKQVDWWLEQLIEIYGMNLMRYKGYINIQGYDHPLIIQGVNTTFHMSKGTKWKGVRKSKIVFIGTNLDQKTIMNLLMVAPVKTR